MPEQVYALTLIERDKGYSFTVFGSNGVNSFVEYSDEDDVKKLRDVIENPGQYKEKIPILWGVKNNEVLKESELELISSEEVRKLVGVDFVAVPQNSVRLRNSEDDLLEAIWESL